MMTPETQFGLASSNSMSIKFRSFAWRCVALRAGQTGDRNIPLDAGWKSAIEMA